jgi:hypothetical protein
MFFPGHWFHTGLSTHTAPGWYSIFVVTLLQWRGNLRTDADYRGNSKRAQNRPVKHGLVTRKQHSAQCPSVIAPYGSWVEQAVYLRDWAGGNADWVDGDN